MPLALLSLCITTLLFITIYLPQVALLALFHSGGSAWVNGTFLVLSEANLIIAIFFEAFFADSTQVDMFDAVLISKGHSDLVKQKRPVNADEPDPVKSLGPREKGAEYAPFSFRQIFEFVILLPLNFVPFVGVPLFLLATGYRAGPLLQYRYHALKGLNKKQKRDFISTKSRRWQYTWFGTAALVLQLIPVLSLLFLLTTAAGSALWAADMEAEMNRESAGDETAATEIPDDEPPAYSDEV